ncbi:hypothetical protein [Emcibacter sp. SYSU 3D8]|uniref:hypothetical protein n=1 Tax=Emcibacter sp. SYSU 3D8 TaxID=3133969 RepID=UPI0031FF2506
MKYEVTLRANLKRGTFYWIATVEADSEDEAAMAAEELFEEQMDSGEEWAFEDFSAEPA